MNCIDAIPRHNSSSTSRLDIFCVAKSSHAILAKSGMARTYSKGESARSLSAYEASLSTNHGASCLGRAEVMRMCLNDSSIVNELHDEVGYKVVAVLNNGDYETPFAHKKIEREGWQEAKPLMLNSRWMIKFGYHAYLSLPSAQRAAEIHRKWTNAEFVILKVELGDVIEYGYDNSFNETLNERACAARAIRVIEEVQ